MALLCATTALWADFTPAAFSVSADKQVAFSQGNLQCTYSATDTTWAFAEYQTDVIGIRNITEGLESDEWWGQEIEGEGGDLADKIDLFGWSGSTGPVMWGVGTSDYSRNYEGDFVDWGTNIGDGTTYRTLMKEEWDYLLNTRTNASEKKGIARINLNAEGTQYANGLILLPDRWTCPAGITFKSGFASSGSVYAYADYQTFTLAQWQQLEAAGAVFLPAAGYRKNLIVFRVQYEGYYRSATTDGYYSYHFFFDSQQMDASKYELRFHGQAVRLVYDLDAVKLTTNGHGTVTTDKTAALLGEMVTITVTSDTYYALKTLSVMQGTTPVTITAVEGTTNQYTFTMPAGEVIVTAEFEKLASAFTPSAFTVAANGKQVSFSQGNLQCTGVTTGDYVWSFPEYQTDMIGTDNVIGGTVQSTTWGLKKSGTAIADKIDLFGWSGSTGSAKWGISTSTDNSDYSGDFVDWGTNTIGINAPNSYRTLTRDEWNYLLNTRANAGDLKGIARINLNHDGSQYANGLILLPDNWTCPVGATFKSGFIVAHSIQAYANYQMLTLAQWQQLEAAGAVFLPAVGYREGVGMDDVQVANFYWSATASDANKAYYSYSAASTAHASYPFNRFAGQAVRLVQDIKYAITRTTPEHGTLAADKTEAVAGETITLTVSTNDAYYVLKTLSVMQGTTPVTTTAVEGTTNQYTFTMPAGEVTVTAVFEKVASAFTPAKFMVSADGKQVTFSQGNLQCTGVTTGNYTWAFAEYQTEMLGKANVSSRALADKIDLFGWSGSTGSAKWGISTSTDNSDYSGDFVDWGTNTIGINAPNSYRTLTRDEWNYLLNTRANAGDLKGIARINLNADGSQYANGLILLPDNWTAPVGVTFKSGFLSISFGDYHSYQTFTLAQWQQLEAQGAVFLPSNAYRDGYGVHPFYGCYWSATASDANYAYCLYVNTNEASVRNYGRNYGYAVRLVQDIKYAVSITAAEHGTVTADKTEAVAGETVTLTVTPDTDYELDVLTVKDAANNDITVTNNTFTMPASAVTVTATFKLQTFTITRTTPEHGTVTADKTEAAAGETVTLTVSTNDAYYALKTITVMQGTTVIPTTAVEGTTNQYTFTMPKGEVTITAEYEKLASAFTPAKFTVSADGKQVSFSQGNLQCALSATDTIWSFAEYQTEMLGTDNVSGGALANTIDLFGWSGNTGSAKWGISTSGDSDDYTGNFVDWGQNTIGTNAPNTYHTLTKDEWNYLINTRANASDRMGVARINLNTDGTQYANGLILLPDNWTTPAGVTFTSGFSSNDSEQAYADYQVFTLAEWQKLESAGAVFLPASGFRGGSSMYYVQTYGYYWSATADDSRYAYRLRFSSDEAYASSSNLYRGQAVRLVQDIKYPLSITTSEHGTVTADKTEAVAGETVTITLTPDTDYELDVLTVKDAANNDITVTNNTFTMPASAVTVTATFKLQTFTITRTTPEHGTVTADKTEAAAGETVTLTVSTNDAYYALKTITVMQGTTVIPTTAVEGTTNRYTFIMPKGEVTITAEFEKLASAFTPSAFTVADDGKQVYFSQGNLQCSGVTTGGYVWSFADYQTEIIGTANVSSDALADKIDLFGWSGSTGSAKWGISTSTDNSDYSGDFVDWGTNTIGINAPNTYRTLTKDEWGYILQTRTNANEKKGVARINLNSDGTQYANGLILLPDNWTDPVGVTFKSGYGSAISIQAYADYQTFTLAEWQQLEAAGAVFLPAAGYREGASMESVQNTGGCWPATASGSDYAYYLYSSSFSTTVFFATDRYDGRAVRLVQDLYAVTITTPEHGTVTTDKTEAAAGETVTLTVAPDAYYQLKAITVTYGEGETAAVTSDYKFMMPAGDVTITAEFEKVASAFTPAAFSIADGKQVLFSQGNLQCSGVKTGNYVWSFAEYQTEIIGTDNVSGGSVWSSGWGYGYGKDGIALADTIDLFGWSGSTGSAKWGIGTSENDNDYAGDFVDWGTNTIGTNAPNTYRTLTSDEWIYIFEKRANASDKKGIARIHLNSDGTHYANGLILLPDSCVLPAGVTFKSGKPGEFSEDAYATHQTFTFAQWQQLEAAGAVFLPAAGTRTGSYVNEVQYTVIYCSATEKSETSMYYFFLWTLNEGPRYEGRSVRLVQDLYTITVTQPEHGTVTADKTEALAGERVTLTVMPDTYYVPNTITVMQGKTVIQTSAVKGTTNQYTFTMPKGGVTVTAEFKKLASAFDPAAFSVSADKQVAFTKGNLQCTGVTTGNYTWSFAEYQTEMLGEANVSGSNLADTIDLFGWSGNTGSAKWGISTSDNNNDYAGNFVDWGQNTIGTNAPNAYRTLTSDEWIYIFEKRANASDKKGIARIHLNSDGTHYANGLILLPDSCVLPAGVTFKSGFASESSIDAYATHQTFTFAQWQKLEAAGAVFLPAAGTRGGASVNYVQNHGDYKSATATDNTLAYCLTFLSNGADASDSELRYFGRTVRLVQDYVLYTITLTQPEHGTVTADKNEAVAGDEVILTVTSDTYYVPKTITVMQGTTVIQTTAVEGTTNQYKFTMPKGGVTVTAEFEKPASAFRPAAFSVSADKQVAFSQGNLQCTYSATDTTWAFAEYQTDVLGIGNAADGIESEGEYGLFMEGMDLADKIDLFGWSGSTSSSQWGIGTSDRGSHYSGDFVDWGTNIGDGTTYRTLTKDEWDYLINTRANAGDLKGVARINLNGDGSQYANGLILLPDRWNLPAGVTFKSGLASGNTVQAYADYQTFTLAQWQQLEAAGAVFLPAAGDRYGLDVRYVQYEGDYWSATAASKNLAYHLFFYSKEMNASRGLERSHGMAVRLVQTYVPPTYTIAVTTTGHGTVTADKTAATEGDEVTLTVTPDTDYELDILTVQDAAGNPITVNDNKFTMPASDVTVSAGFKEIVYNFTPAAFSVSADKQVAFSRGNLQCVLSATDTTWAFARNQYDMIGSANVSGTALADPIDLFGWSANNTTAPWGISTSEDYNDYTGNFVDWGTNTIGTNTPNTYRTLTNDEWKYLFETRPDASDRMGVARINLNEDGSQYANGLILLPDSWDIPAGVTFESGFASESSIDAYATHQTFTLAQWQQLEAAGAVFLPASGIRKGSNMGDVQGLGCYWSSTTESTGTIFHKVESSRLSVWYSSRKFGYAVRLVQDYVSYTITITTTGHGTVTANKTYAAAGERVTLTVTPDMDYELGVLTVQDAAGNPVTVNDNKFTMPASNVTISATFQRISSAVGNTTDTADTTVRKILRNGQVLILRAGKTYTIVGVEVE